MHRVLTGRPVRIVFSLLVVGLVVRTVVADRDDVVAALARFSSAAVALALASVVVALLASLVAWRSLLAGLGSPLPWPVAARILFVGQLGKYVPGAVWPMVAQMELGDDHGVPRRRSGTVFALLMLLNLASALAVACLLLPFATGFPHELDWLVLLAPLLLAAFHPRVVNPGARVLLRLIGRLDLEQPLSGRTCSVALAAMMAQWLFLGLHVLVLGVSLGADPDRLLASAIGGFAVAWAIGPLVVIAPAGLGFREITLLAVLSPLLGGSGALVVAVTSRVLMTVVDVGLALVSGLVGAKRRHPPLPHA